MKDNLLYSKSTDLNVNHIQKHLLETSSKMFDQISGHHGPDKLMHKINHQTAPGLSKNYDKEQVEISLGKEHLVGNG